ncbi:MAG: hydrolase [Candidatus Taylorbacteria bacterium]|nr:hydrolase [Candidatus Taylorbacteria bacterium]
MGRIQNQCAVRILRNKNMRDEIRKIIESIEPYDDLEALQINNTIEWINSGEEIFRIKKPAIPPKHLVSFFTLIDLNERKILFMDHIKAELWLPAGGHIEKDEHPKTTVEREIKEELNIAANFINPEPLFLTEDITVGKTAGHTDVSLWYILNGDSKNKIIFDPGEFNGYKWFDFKEILNTDISKFNKNTHRFMRKLLQKLESVK